ncbi:hypothetical protein E2C01_075426 [Portunus trituberculatus]|uniref:Uncharacterized protein n=1 Tax=Portunus trituberculatus TaxID=210409 RepID=A0A5B7IEY6_PORTR|nr:hypothetical protein [Portunus trituberculatus]
MRRTLDGLVVPVQPSRQYLARQLARSPAVKDSATR